MQRDDALEALRALAHPIRLDAFRALVVAGPQGLTPGALTQMLDVAYAKLGFHLKDLVDAGLVASEPAGRHVIYRAVYPRMDGLLRYLTDHCCAGTPCAPHPHRGRLRPLTHPTARTHAMKRFHVHVHVQDLQASIAFYSRLFAAPPTRVEADYAKWMLEDPRVNFAISHRGGAPGLDHLGFQADSDTELAELKDRARGADMALLDEGETTCCYARSDKYWLTDPDGIAWEQFHTLDSIPTFSASAAAAPSSAQPASACCPGDKPRGKPVGIAVKSSSCC